MRFFHRLVVPLLFFPFCLTPFTVRAQEPSPQQSPGIRVSVDRVNVGAIVTDGRGRFISGLRREDFRILDNGVEQPVSDFLSIEEPAQLVLLIECGPAVYFLSQGHVRSADALLSSVGPADRVAIVCYSKGPDPILGFTADKAESRMALRGLEFNNGFAELNLSSSLATTLDWLTPLSGKKTIVLLSTGVDTSPQSNWEFVRQKLETSDVRILAVSLSGDFRKPARIKKLSPQARSDRAFVKLEFAEADRQLKALSAATGGRVYFPRNAKEFDRAYAEIAQLVRHEYSLAFVPPTLDGRIHSIDVRVNNSSYRVDHRQAYLAPPPGP